ncbi:MAG TPA: class I SAM-dependent methyltransferase [Blastocatellia bacterium]
MHLDVKATWNACGEAFDRFTTAEDSFAENVERPAVERLIGNLAGQRLLDLGCGSGTYSVVFVEHGAQVVGLDLSQTMISLARERARARSVQADFRVADIIEPLPFSQGEFDAVFTGTALHYVESLGPLMNEIQRVMKPGGRLVASVLHPMSTSRFPLASSDELEGPDPWEAWYFGPQLRCIETPWLGFGEVKKQGRQILCYHHTITEYFDAVSAAGLAIIELIEPAPPPEFAAKNASRYNEAMRVPVFLVFKAEKSK